MLEKENIELLIIEGINYLNSQLSSLEFKTKKINCTFKDYIKKYASLIVNERINNMLKNNEKNSYKKIIETFNQINSYMSSKITNKKENNKALLIVFSQYTSMLENNLKIDSNLEENFQDWCENGNVFFLFKDSEKYSEQFKKECMSLMKQAGKDLDNYTNILFKIYEEGKNRDEESEEEEL